MSPAKAPTPDSVPTNPDHHSPDPNKSKKRRGRGGPIPKPGGVLRPNVSAILLRG